jgi:hypothetical protein
MKELLAKAAYHELVQMLAAEAIAYLTVPWYFCAAKVAVESKETPSEAGAMQTDSVEAAIAQVVVNNPFSSQRELSWLTYLSRPTVHRHLTELVGFTIYHLQWITQRLSDDQKTIRVIMSRELLQVLQRKQNRGRHDSSTLNES